MARKTKPTAVDKPRREPNAKEVAAMEAAKATYEVRPVRVEVEERPKPEDGAYSIGPKHTDEKGHSYELVGSFATTSEPFTTACLLDLANISVAEGKVDTDRVNAKLALLGAIDPQNELETALALQMVATHDLSMDLLRRTKTATTRDAMMDFGNLATKLSRTFTAQMKALSEHRRGGEQVVRHIHVYQGGQAVVAETVNVGDRGNEKLGARSHALGTALLGENPQGHTLPNALHQGAQAVPNAQRAGEGRAGQ